MARSKTRSLASRQMRLGRSQHERIAPLPERFVRQFWCLAVSRFPGSRQHITGHLLPLGGHEIQDLIEFRTIPGLLGQTFQAGRGRAQGQRGRSQRSRTAAATAVHHAFHRPRHQQPLIDQHILELNRCSLR